MEIKELIAQIPIDEYIGQYVDLEWRGEELWGISPFTYPPEKTPSFSVRPKTGQFYDFSSSIGGNLFTFITKYHKVSNAEAVKIMQEYAGVSDSTSSSSSAHAKFKMVAVCKKYKRETAPKKEMTVDRLDRKYMDMYEDAPDKLQTWRDEGISDETMRFFGVKYDRFTNRIVYPIKDLSGEVVNVGGRTLDPDYKAKKLRKYTYIKPWGGRMAVIYGIFENMDAIRAANEVILFEGAKSVMIAREFGYKNCGAILTSHLNPAQMEILARLGVNCVFALDKEIAVMDDKNINKLKHYVRVEYLFDRKGLLGEKDAPVDKGLAIFSALYAEKSRLW